MKQAVVVAPLTIEYREVAEPKATSDSVIIRTARIGICGSDLHAFQGKHPLVKFPLIQGHEFSGYVENFGSEVGGLQIGDLVTVQPAIGCGECDKCKVGLIAQCDKLLFVGGALPGAGSDLIAVQKEHVLKMPAGVDADDAAMVEPLSVAVHAVRRVSSIKNRRTLVFGGGTIGNLVAQVAREFGAGRTAVVDKVSSKRRLAENLGFLSIDVEHVQCVEDEIRRTFDNRSPEVCFECVGKPVALNGCITSVVRGGDVVILGVFSGDPQTRMILVQDKEINMLGSLMYTWDDYRTAIDLIAEKKVNLKPLQTNHFPFEKWGEAYDLLLGGSGDAVKVIIDMA